MLEIITNKDLKEPYLIRDEEENMAMCKIFHDFRSGKDTRLIRANMILNSLQAQHGGECIICEKEVFSKQKCAFNHLECFESITEENEILKKKLIEFTKTKNNLKLAEKERNSLKKNLKMLTKAINATMSKIHPDKKCFVDLGKLLGEIGT